jgi:GTP cyclohydrolase I
MGSQDQQADYQYDVGTEVVTGPAVGFDEQKAREGARLLLEAVGRNPNEAGVYETWNRRVPAMLETLTEGMRPEAKPVMRTFDSETDGLVIKTGIPLYSLCEHHMLPFHGVAHVAYRPGESMVGLSKLVRYIRWQSRRLTTQEELTRDIAAGLDDELDAEGVLVELTATHTCEAMRGVETVTATTTRETVGAVSDTDREQFRESIRRDGVGGISC